MVDRDEKREKRVKKGWIRRFFDNFYWIGCLPIPRIEFLLSIGVVVVLFAAIVCNFPLFKRFMPDLYEVSDAILKLVLQSLRVGCITLNFFLERGIDWIIAQPIVSNNAETIYEINKKI